MASAPTPHRETLFHLVPPPRNELAQAALTHDDNRKFVSMAASNRPGLEVGFHVPLYSHGPVITRLGRDADLILPGASCGVHLEFRISASTKLLKLIDRFMERNRPTVFVQAPDDRGNSDDPENTSTATVSSSMEPSISSSLTNMFLTWSGCPLMGRTGPMPSRTWR